MVDDERRLSDVDRRVRAAISPPADVVARVVRGALSAGDVQPRRRLRAAAVVACALLVLSVGFWQVRRRPPVRPASTSLSITNEGSLLVVVGADGRRWVVGPAAERRAPGSPGSYVIVVSE